MKKNLFLFAALATMIAGCSGSDEADKNSAPLSPDPIGFDVYAQRATSRAGVAGDLTTDALKTGTHKDAGFGVFAYYTDNNSYDAFATPNFMYNQQVKWVTDKWTYEPVKYWPNEYGTNALSDDVDQVSFFAYAPWVEVTPSTGVVKTGQTEGITGMTKNSAIGDPIVKYIASLDPAKCVDLCWGVVNPAADVTWNLETGTGAAATQTFAKGLPFLNVKHPKTTEKMQFYFQHALSQLNVQVDAYVDGVAATNAVDAKTKIYIRSITFTGIATKGALNLNNIQAAKAQWLDYAGSNDLTSEEYTIFDGRKDGNEGYADGAQSNEKVTGLNPALIQKETATAGVTNTAVNLFNSATETAPIMIIPTGEAMTVTIVYDVETEDANLATYLSDGKTHGSSVENRITTTGNVFTSLENGKKYTVKLHLGMNSVKFDAAVSAWTDVTSATDSNLPSN